MDSANLKMKFSLIVIGLSLFAGLIGQMPSSLAKESINIVEREQDKETLLERTEGNLIAIDPRIYDTIENLKDSGVRNPLEADNIRYKIGNFDSAVNDLRFYWAIPYGKPILDQVDTPNFKLKLVRVQEGMVNAVARTSSSQNFPTLEVQDVRGSSIALLKVRYVSVFPF